VAKKKKTGLGTDAFFPPASQDDSLPADQDDSEPVDQLDSLTVDQLDSEPVSRQASKPARRRSISPGRMGAYINGEKTKATYYLSEETLQALDEALPKLKRLAGGLRHKEKRRLVTKSLVVEAALQIVLADLAEGEEQGTHSPLAKKMMEI